MGGPVGACDSNQVIVFRASHLNASSLKVVMCDPRQHDCGSLVFKDMEASLDRFGFSLTVP
jgi:hypothetical protein